MQATGYWGNSGSAVKKSGLKLDIFPPLPWVGAALLQVPKGSAQAYDDYQSDK